MLVVALWLLDVAAELDAGEEVVLTVVVVLPDEEVELLLAAVPLVALLLAAFPLAAFADDVSEELALTALVVSPLPEAPPTPPALAPAPDEDNPSSSL